MNASSYKGYAPRQTPAQRAERAMRKYLGDQWVDDHNNQRVQYYRDLLRKVRAQKAL